MKRLKTIINATIWTLCALYLSIVVLLNIPAVQAFVGSQTANFIGNALDTKVSIGRIDLGLLNRVIIDNVRIDDQANKKLLTATRLSAKISFTDLVKGGITISSAQIFGLDANIYRKDEKSNTNLQFIIDALASKDTTNTKKPLNLEIGSLVIRHGKVRYNQLDSPDFRLTSLKHIDLSDISAHIILNRLTNDSINLNIKKLALKDKSGLKLRDFKLRAIASKKKAEIDKLYIALPKSEINVDKAVATYDAKDSKSLLPSLQYEAEMEHSHVYLPDLAAVVPELAKLANTINISTSISGTGTSMKVARLEIDTDNGSTKLSADGSLSNGFDSPKWIANIALLKVGNTTIDKVLKAFNPNKAMPTPLANLGDIAFVGSIGGKGNDISANGNLKTSAGSLKIDGGKEDRNLSLSVSTNDCNLAEILDNDKLGILATEIKVTAMLQNEAKNTGNGKARKGILGKIQQLKANGNIDKFQYNGYVYSNINIDGKLDGNNISGQLAINDENIKLNANGTFATDHPKADLLLQLGNICPKALGLTDKWGDACFAANVDADFVGTNVDNANGNITISNFSMATAEDTYNIRNVSLSSRYNDERHTITLNSDFANVGITGQFHIADLIQYVENLVAEKLPSIQQLTPIRTRKAPDCRMLFYADIMNTEPLQRLLNVPVALKKPARIDGYMNSLQSELSIQASVPQLSISDQDYADISLSVSTPADALNAILKAKKVLSNGNKAEYALDAMAANNKLSAALVFDNHSKLHIKGNMNANAQFSRNEEGKVKAVVNIMPSHMMIDDTNWDIMSSTLTYSPKHIEIENFAIEHDDQHIHINGLATEDNSDSLTVDLKDVDVAYILNLVNFHAVDFDGHASCKAFVSGTFGTPHAKAYLTVDKFTFEEGRMGTLYADVAWNNEQEQIDINAKAKDEGGRHTDINGYVSPKRNYIDLGISAHNTRAEFMLGFCSSFMDKCDVNANGDVRLWGSLSALNLTGDLDIAGKIGISSLNTEYSFNNAHVRLLENEIQLPGDTIIDHRGNTGVVTGSLHHQHLSRLTYDIGVKANNLLAYNFDGSDGSTFYGTAYATGQCNIRGRSGEVVMDIDVVPNEGSIVTYNVSSPDAIKSQEFINWVDRDSMQLQGTKINLPQGLKTLADMPSDIRLNFLVHTQPTATIRLIMDNTSGDYIDLRGSGVIRATYYNKGSFDLYGNYLVESGVYKLTIQNALHKDFEFMPGGTIAFGGNPYDAILNLKAMYPVNSVSLSDLQLGRSFTSNNIRVNCLMNITGTPNQPKVDFGLDMPTVSSDAKQMIYNLINSEEEMNQQVIYLLAVGRFYSQGNNNANAEGEAQSQTTLAMQSILSGQISQQINSLLGTVINNNNWNFGANISTGDEGWNNAEYEGLLSGRLLNNRLLFNGQFGYRDNANATQSFIGDFDLRYLLFPNGNLAVRVYNQSNDRYFTRNSLNTQGLGFILKKDFNGRRKNKKGKKVKR